MDKSKIGGASLENNSNINNTENPFKSDFSDQSKNPFHSNLSQQQNNSMINNNFTLSGQPNNNNIDNDPTGEQFVFRLSQLSQQSQMRNEFSLIQNEDENQIIQSQNNSLMKNRLENSMLRDSNLSIDQNQNNQQFASFGQSMIKDSSAMKNNNNNNQFEYSQFSNFAGQESDLKQNDEFTLKDNSQISLVKSNMNNNNNQIIQNDFNADKSEISEIRPPSDFQQFGQANSSRFQSNFSNMSKLQQENQGEFKSAPQNTLSKTMIKEEKNVDFPNFVSDKSDLARPIIRQIDGEMNQPIMENNLENSSSYENKEMNMSKLQGHEIPRISEESRFSEGKYLNPYRQSDQKIELRNSVNSVQNYYQTINRVSEEQLQQYMPNLKKENNQEEQQGGYPYGQKIEHIDDQEQQDQSNKLLLKSSIKQPGFQQQQQNNNFLNRDSVGSFGDQRWSNANQDINNQFNYQQPIGHDQQRYSIIPNQNNQQFMEFQPNTNTNNFENPYRISNDTNNNRFSYNRSSVNRLSNQSQNNRLSFQSFKFDQQTGQSANRTSAMDSNRISNISVIKEENLTQDQAKQLPGCTCTKTKCLKMYCICFQNQRDCGPTCRCIDCFNNPAHEDHRQHAVKQILHRNPEAFTDKIDQLNNNQQQKQNNTNPEINKLFQQPTNNLFNQEITKQQLELRDSIIKSSSIIDKNAQQASQQQQSIGYKKGCNCRKTQCLKKYCECYNAGVKCHSLCKCDNCHNQDNQDAMELEDSRQQDLQSIEQEYTRQKILQKLSIAELQQLQERKKQVDIVGKGIVD